MPLHCPHCKTAQAEDRTVCIQCNLPLETSAPFQFAPPKPLDSSTSDTPQVGGELPMRPLVRAAPFSSAPPPESSSFEETDTFDEPSESFSTLERATRRPFEPLSFLAGIGGAAAVAVVGFALFSLTHPRPHAAPRSFETIPDKNKAENFVVTAPMPDSAESAENAENSAATPGTSAPDDAAGGEKKTQTVQIESSSEGQSVAVGTPVTITWTPSRPGIYEFSARDVDGGAQTARSRTLVLAAGDQIAPPRISRRETPSVSEFPDIPPAPPLPPMPVLPSLPISSPLPVSSASALAPTPVVKTPISRIVTPKTVTPKPVLTASNTFRPDEKTTTPKVLVSPSLEGPSGPDAPPTIESSEESSENPAVSGPPVFHVVASVFPFADNADRLAAALRLRGFHPSVHKSVSNGRARFVVEAGTYRQEEIARQKLTDLLRAGYQARLFVGQ